MKYANTSDLKIEEGRLQVVVGGGEIGFIEVSKKKGFFCLKYRRYYAPVLWNDILIGINQEIPHNFKGSFFHLRVKKVP